MPAKDVALSKHCNDVVTVQPYHSSIEQSHCPGDSDSAASQTARSKNMKLQRDEILALARQAKLMYVVDGDHYFLNEMATEKELISLVRLIESALMKEPKQSKGPKQSALLTR
jgi:hypothetical protein